MKEIADNKNKMSSIQQVMITNNDMAEPTQQINVPLCVGRIL